MIAFDTSPPFLFIVFLFALVLVVGTIDGFRN